MVKIISTTNTVLKTKQRKDWKKRIEGCCWDCRKVSKRQEATMRWVLASTLCTKSPFQQSMLLKVWPCFGSVAEVSVAFRSILKLLIITHQHVHSCNNMKTGDTNHFNLKRSLNPMDDSLLGSPFLQTLCQVISSPWCCIGPSGSLLRYATSWPQAQL